MEEMRAAPGARCPGPAWENFMLGAGGRSGQEGPDPRVPWCRGVSGEEALGSMPGGTEVVALGLGRVEVAGAGGGAPREKAGREGDEARDDHAGKEEVALPHGFFPRRTPLQCTAGTGARFRKKRFRAAAVKEGKDPTAPSRSRPWQVILLAVPPRETPGPPTGSAWYA